MGTPRLAPADASPDAARSNSEPKASPLSGTFASAKKVVLVVDDDEAIRALLRRVLSKEYDVVEAVDGYEASELLGTMNAPSLIICDVAMPRVDGFSLARMLKTKQATRTVPVMFLTARNSPTDVVRAINLGARHFIEKPFKVTDLLAKVTRTLT